MITSSANPAVKAARKLARRHGRARAGDAFLVEGPQAVAEATGHLRELFATPDAADRHAALLASAADHDVQIHTVSPDVLGEIATTVTPQGLVGVAVLPSVQLDDVLPAARLVVVLHQVRDPGNAGTAVRTADAAGADAVVLTRGSVDVRNPKTVRASTGSLFHLPVIEDQAFSEVADACRRHGLSLAGLTSDGDRTHTQAALDDRVALVFGNEAHGLPTAVRAQCDQLVRIPLLGEPRPGYGGVAESLNLAVSVAVVAYEAARQRSADLSFAPPTR